MKDMLIMCGYTGTTDVVAKSLDQCTCHSFSKYAWTDSLQEDHFWINPLWG